MKELEKGIENLRELILSFDKSGIPTGGLKEVLSQLEIHKHSSKVYSDIKKREFLISYQKFILQDDYYYFEQQGLSEIDQFLSIDSKH